MLGRIRTTVPVSAPGTYATSIGTSVLREAGERPLADREVLDAETRAFEAIALGLRRVDGVGRRDFAREFGRDPVERFADRIRDGDASRLLEWDRDHLRLTPRGRLFASEACLAFLPEPVG